VGLTDPRTGRWPNAVVQLRPEDGALSAYNMVGFQTRMKFAEQQRVFALIPGLERAEYLRFGSVHRNTFVNAPAVLDEHCQLRAAPGVFLAGQIAGVEGYVESAASGLCVGLLLAQRARGAAGSLPPGTTALGALLGHLRRSDREYQPSNVLWSMFPELALPEAEQRSRALRRQRLGERALVDLEIWRRGLDSGETPMLAQA
jgi:methylenetetrahydrofolate--tRNA-(uracil-5-)-methyltransferase